MMSKVRTKVNGYDEWFMEDLHYLQSEEVGEFGKNYWEYHTKESEMPQSSLDLIRSYFP